MIPSSNPIYAAIDLQIALGKKIICSAFHWEIHRGEIWGILGANGAGKTTLLHTLAGFRKPISGKRLLHQQGLHTLSSQKIATLSGLLLQETHLHFPETVFYYCLAARYPHLSYFSRPTEKDRDIVTACLRQMDLLTFAQQNVLTLSGGERRRLAIAALLTQAPSLYWLDEPNNHLDLKHQAIFFNHLQTLAREESAAIVCSLHDPNLVERYCSHVLLLLGQGEVRQGEIKNILTAENLSRLYQHPIQALATNQGYFWM